MRTTSGVSARVTLAIGTIIPDDFFHPHRDPTPGLGVALLAQRILPRDVAYLTRKKAAGWRSLLVLGATDGDLHEAGDSVRGGAGDAGAKLGVHSEERFCPLTGFDITAVEWSMPEALRRVAREAEAEAAACAGADGDHQGDASAAAPFSAVRVWVRVVASLPLACPCSFLTAAHVVQCPAGIIRASANLPLLTH